MKPCMYCKHDNPENARYCENCGMPLDKNSKVVCTECGKMVRNDYKFCPHCGAGILHTAHCTSCNALLDPGDKFCKQCGHAVPASSHSPVFKREDPATVINQFADILLDTSMPPPSDIFDNNESTDVMEKNQQQKPAIVTAEEAQNDPNLFIDYCLQEGLQKMTEGDYREAVNHFNKGVGVLIKNGYDKKEDRRLIQYYINRGTSFKNLNDTERAQDNFRRALMYAQSIFAVHEVEVIRHLMAES